MPVEFRSRLVSRWEAEERSSQTTREELFKLGLTKEFKEWRKRKSESETAGRKTMAIIAASILLALLASGSGDVYLFLKSSGAPEVSGQQGPPVLEEIEPPATGPVFDRGDNCAPCGGASHEPEHARIPPKGEEDVSPLALERGQEDQGTITLDKRILLVVIAAVIGILGAQACVVAWLWRAKTKVVLEHLETQRKLAALESELHNQGTEIAARDALLKDRDDDLRIKDSQIASLMSHVREAGEQMHFQRQEIAIVTADLRRARQTIALSEAYVLRLQEAARVDAHVPVEDEGRTT